MTEAAAHCGVPLQSSASQQDVTGCLAEPAAPHTLKVCDEVLISCCIQYWQIAERLLTLTAPKRCLAL